MPRREDTITAPAPPVRMAIHCLLAVILMWASPAAMGSAFWVWNREDGLTGVERAQLKAAGVTTLYWQCAEIENTTGNWQWKKMMKLPERSTADLRVVPVIRLESSVADPFSINALGDVTAKLAAAFAKTGADEWQLDYDAPDRLVAGYAGVLRDLRKHAPKLTTTALAGWIHLPAFAALQANVDGICPMFYDLEPDTAATLRPLLDVDGTRKAMEAWTKRCTVPWQAGLPWFGRLSVYGADGRCQGHLRQWAWNDVVFRRGLRVVSPTKDGITTLRAEESIFLGTSRVDKGSLLVARWPDLAGLKSIEANAPRDVVFFRLPNASASSGWSLGQFATRRNADSPPRVDVRVVGNHLVLANAGSTDMPARMLGDGPGDRGYALELDATGAVFREADAGEFARLTAHVQPDSPQQQSANVTTATRLTFWFAALPAGENIRSGFLQFAPGVKSSGMRWRVLPCQPTTPWIPLAVLP